MSGYDGTIRVDSSIDPKGFNKGTKLLGNSLSGLMKSVAGVGKALLAAFVGGTIISAIRGIIGSFDLMNSSIGGSLKPLASAFETLKGSFANLIATALIPLVPYIVTVVNWLTNLVQIATQAVAAFFGMQKTVGGITKEIKKTAKETKGALAAFDAINVLNITKPEDAQGEPNTPTPAAMEVPQDMFNKVQELKKQFLDMLKEIEKGISEWFSDPAGKIQETWGKIVDWFRSEIVPSIVDAMDSMFPPDSDIRTKFIDPLAVGFHDFVDNLKVLFSDMWDAITDDSLSFPEKLRKLWDLVMQFITDRMVEVKNRIVEILAEVLQKITDKFVTAKNRIVETLTNISQWIKGNVGIPIQESFGRALDWVKDKFHSIFENIRTFVTGIIDRIIDNINNMIALITDGINFVLTGVNAISGGLLGTPSIPPVANYQMPHLATGAVIPPNSQFAAILGDHKSQNEILAPEDTLRKIFSEALQNYNGGGETVVNMTLTLDGEEIYQNQKRVQHRHGTSLISGGVFR